MTMVSPALISISSAARRLAGPVFDKELRVASRQRKNYIIRFAYIGLLTVFVAGVWFSSAPQGISGSVVYQASRMGTAGRYIAVTIIWFQFIAAQFLPGVLLGNAVSGEIRKRTLHVLAVTPISGMQIVGGKLAGGLIHVVMLLATSLPLLAIVRVFGGISWAYVLSGVCITFSATVFAGALSLLISAFYQNVFVGVVQGVWYCVLGRVFDGLIEWLAHFSPVIGEIGSSILQLVNPTDVLLTRTRDLLAARSSTGLSAWWPLHCLILLGSSVAVLWWTARRVRAVAAAPPAAGAPGYGRGRSLIVLGEGANRTKGFLRRHARALGPIRRVEGPPVLWKELRNFSVLGSRRSVVMYGVPVLVAGLLVAAVMVIGVWVAGGDASAVAGGMMGCAWGLQFGVVLGASGAAAGAIAKEKEAKTLPLLLTTPLEDDEIVKHKAVALVRQSLPLLVLLSIFLLFSTLCFMESTGKAKPLPIVCGAGLYFAGLLGIMPLLLGLGLYCGVRLKTTAAASGCMFAVVCVGLVTSIFVIGNLASHLRRAGPQMWLTVPISAILAVLTCAGVGLILLRAAARQLRRHVFL